MDAEDSGTTASAGVSGTPGVKEEAAAIGTDVEDEAPPEGEVSEDPGPRSRRANTEVNAAYNSFDRPAPLEYKIHNYIEKMAEDHEETSDDRNEYSRRIWNLKTHLGCSFSTRSRRPEACTVGW